MALHAKMIVKIMVKLLRNEKDPMCLGASAVGSLRTRQTSVMLFAFWAVRCLLIDDESNRGGGGR